MVNKKLFLAQLLNAESQLIRTQYTLLAAITEELTNGEDVDDDTFSLLVEDNIHDRALPVPRAKELVLSTGAFVFDGDFWQYNHQYTFENKLLSFEEFQSLLLGNKEKNGAVTNEDREKNAILNGLRWCVSMVELAEKDDMDGLPAFLRCGEQDSLIGKNVAGTATPDALSLLCRGISYIKETKISPEKLEAAFSFLVEKTLQCQFKGEGWDQGGFLPLEDQPESDHPTVDATCLSIMALCDFYEGRKKLLEAGIEVDLDSTTIEKAVFEGIDFLLRMQQPEGSFGIYRYEAEYPDGCNLNRDCATGYAQPNENCTRIALSTMGVCKGSGIFDATERFEYYGKCSEVISRAYVYLKEHMAPVNEGAVWAPYFGDTAANYPVADILVSSGRVCRCFIPVWWQIEDEREAIRKYNTDFIAYWCRVSEGDVEDVGRYSFKTPRKESYSVAMYSWQSYPGTIAGFAALQAYNMFGIALTKAEWKVIDEAVSEALDIQHEHGHWNLPKTTQPFCAATLAAIELLIEYRNAKGLY